MPTRWCGHLTLFPVRRGTIAKGRTLYAEKKLRQEGTFGEALVTVGERGKIIKVKKTKNKVYVFAAFKKHKKSKRIGKKTLIKMILKSIDFRKGNLEKLLTRMFYLNFSEKDLQRILKQGGKFQRPKAFESKWEGESIYLKVGNRYYQM